MKQVEKGALMGYRCCETCGNRKCKDNLVAIHYDDCIESNYQKYWIPRYVWIPIDGETPEMVDELCMQMDILLQNIVPNGNIEEK